LSNLVYIWTDSKFGKITVTPCDVVKLQSIVFAKITVAHNDSVNLTVNPNTELLDLKERNNLNPLNLNPIALKRCNDYRAVWSKCKIQLDPLVLRSNSSCAVIEEDNYNNQNSKFNSTSNKMHHQFQISALRLLVFHNTQIHNENSQGRDYELSPTTNKWHHKL
jgi:hypothetical protein